MPANAERVVPLQEMTAFDVAEGDPDVRGWDVLSAEGLRLGIVEDLLVDIDAMKVRYLDVDLDRNFKNCHGFAHVLIPMTRTRLDEERTRLVVEGIDIESIPALPRYDGEFTRELEQKLSTCFDHDPLGSFPTHLPRPGELV